MISREPFKLGWMAAETTRCYFTPSCGDGISNSGPLSPQLWTLQDLSTARNSCAIMRAVEAAGIPPLLIKYLKNLYASSTTTLSGTDWSSEPIKVTRGVKQGEPLSPVIFNHVIDQLLRSLPQECGSTYNGKTVRAMAFADDLVLLADSPIGLQHLLDWTSTFLGTCDLLLNTSKCQTVLIVGNGGLRKTVVDANQIFHINGQPLRALSGRIPGNI